MLWHGRCAAVAYGCRKTKKLICSMDQGENADGLWRLTSQLGNSSDDGLSLEAIEDHFFFFIWIKLPFCNLSCYYNLDSAVCSAIAITYK